jgi:thioredoxin-related protein
MKISVFATLFFLMQSVHPIAAQEAVKQEIKWMTIEEAIAAQKKQPKKILIDVYTNWCGPCRMMNNDTFKNDSVVAYINKHFYAVKFNAEGNDTVVFRGQTFTNPNYDPSKVNGRNGTHEFAAIAALQGRLSYPTIVYLDEQLDILSPVPGYIKAPEIEPILRFFAENIYLTQKWEEYHGAFEGRF